MHGNKCCWDEKLNLGVLRAFFKILPKPTEAIEIEEFFQASYAHGSVVPFRMVTIVFDQWKYWFISYEKNKQWHAVWFNFIKFSLI